MALISAVQPRNLDKGSDSVEFVPRAEVIGMPHAVACHGQIVSRCIFRSFLRPAPQDSTSCPSPSRAPPLPARGGS